MDHIYFGSLVFQQLTLHMMQSCSRNIEWDICFYGILFSKTYDVCVYNTQIITTQNSCFRFKFKLNQFLFERHTRRKCHFENIISELSTIVPNSVSNSFVNYYESQKIPSCLNTTKSQIKMDFLLVFVQFKYKKRGRRKKRKVNFLKGNKHTLIIHTSN